ncbi:MAG: CehA/McbA family metallohydrolase, partial [Thermodesulfobacteriota bacterium]
MAGGPVECVANLHVHTTFSDGSGRMDQVVKAARKAGLDVLLINDHDTLEAREKGYEGYYGRLLVLVGVEVSGPHNHYLAYGLRAMPRYNWQDPQDFIDRIKAVGGVGFLAHPHEKGSPLSEGGRAFTWEDWSVGGYDGLEIWNHTSCWKAKAQNLPSALYHYFLRTWTLDGPEPKTLALWDEINEKRAAAGLGGSDAHAHPAR